MIEAVTKDGLNADDISEECRNEYYEQDDCHHDGGWLASFQAARAPCDPDESPPHREQQENGVTYASEEYIECLESAGSVDESDSQGEQNPTDDVVTDPGGEYHDPNGGIE